MEIDTDLGGLVKIAGEQLKISAGFKASLDNIADKLEEEAQARKAAESLRPYTELIMSLPMNAVAGAALLPFPTIRMGREVELRSIVVGGVSWSGSIANVSAIIGTGPYTDPSEPPPTTFVRDVFTIVPNGSFYSRGQFPIHPMDTLWILLSGSGVSPTMGAMVAAGSITSYPQ